MFGINLGSSFQWPGSSFGGWGGYGSQAQQPAYSPWTSWTNNLQFTNNAQFPSPYSQSTWDRVDASLFSNQGGGGGAVGGVGGGGGVDTSQDIFQQNDYMRRLQIMQALGPNATRQIPNWRTMPFNDFLLTVARLRGTGNVNPNPQQQQRLPVNVVAHSIWDQGQRVPVKTVNVWDLGADSQNTYNSNQQNDVYTRFDRGIKGKRYRITVEWENGRSYQWDHTNDGSQISIYAPNR